MSGESAVKEVSQEERLRKWCADYIHHREAIALLAMLDVEPVFVQMSRGRVEREVDLDDQISAACKAIGLEGK